MKNYSFFERGTRCAFFVSDFFLPSKFFCVFYRFFEKLLFEKKIQCHDYNRDNSACIAIWLTGIAGDEPA